MSFARLPRTMRTASFGLAVAYALLFAGSVAILGGIVYLMVQSSLDRQMEARVDAEIDLLTQELRSRGKFRQYAWQGVRHGSRPTYLSHA